jgi:uncharacterized protein YoxC
MKEANKRISITERATTWIGSIPSLIFHTLCFVGAFIAVFFGYVELNTMLLVLTTLVSLEAIYLNIFIQMSVNRNTESLREVEEDIEEIQEDVEELGEDLDEIQEDIEEMSEDVEGMSKDVEEISKDVEEMSEDVGEMQKDIEEMNEEEEKLETERKNAAASVTLDQLTDDIRKILKDLDQLKGGK